MTRARRVVALAAVVVATVLAAPLALRHVGFFRVRRVELVGLRYHTPEALLAALALEPDRNLFDPSGAVVARAEALPAIERARVVRRLPGTLRIVVVERAPVAFAPGPDGFVALDRDGRALPYDPVGAAFDLPLLERADSVLAATLAAVRVVDTSLFRDVDGARRGPGDAVTLELGSRQVLLKALPTRDELRAVEVVRGHLAATGEPFAALDARFAGWVVVRRSREGP